jgi:hypothetical protein
MRKILIALSIIIVIATGAYYYLRYNKLRDFEPDIKKKLDRLVQQASHGLYHLDVEALDTDVLDGKIVLTNAHLRADTDVYAKMEKEERAPNDLFDVKVKQLLINEVDIVNFLTNREINLRRLFINQPTITVSHKKQPYTLAEDSSRTIFQQIQKDLNNIKIDSIILNEIDFVYKNVTKKKEERLLNLKVFMQDFLIDSSTQFDQQRFLFAEKALITLKDYKMNTPDSLYRFSVGDLRIETNTRQMHLDEVTFKPRVSTAAFYKVVKHQKDKFDISVKGLKFTVLDWWSLLAEETFFAQKLEMNNGSIRIYNDKSMPEDKRSKVGKYPHQLLMKLPFELRIDSIDLNNFDVSYTEKNPATGETGSIHFENVYAMVRNVTNIKDEIKKHPSLRITAKARFMKEAPLNAEFRLSLAGAASGKFTVNATLGAIKGSTINKITRPLAMVEIKSANVKSLNLSVKGDNNRGIGTVKLIYDNLQITALKKEDNQLKKRGLLSFIANNFVIKTKNPADGKPPRVETGTFTRVPNKSFFNLIWKSTFVAAGKTVGFKAK